ncbi:MAG TPA: gas vesicle protein GvpG [Vicinamibacterales bacterium]|nr:gas vesicle protein GvpG [Vicinamibacterales bacterium]
MLLVDDLIFGGLRFVLDKIARAVDQELNDETAVREQLLNAQMRAELGEISERDFRKLERALLARLRAIRDRRTGGSEAPGDFKVTGVEATLGGDEP